MATNLTDELLKQLQTYYGQNASGYSSQTPTNIGGTMYQQNMNQGGYAGEGGDGGSWTPGGYTTYKPGATTGDAWQQYDPTGKFTAEGILQKDPWLKNLLIAAAGAFGMSQIPVGAIGGGAGAAGGSTFGTAASAGDAFLPGALSGDAFMPGALSIGGNVGTAGVLPGLEGYLATGAAGTASAAGAAGGSLGGGGSSIMDKIGSGLSSLTGGGSSNLLGLGATALGGLAGSQGKQDETSQTRNLPSWLQQPVANDLVGRVQQLIAQQMPQAQQAGQTMRNQGMNLLNQPVAGNGFARFYGA